MRTTFVEMHVLNDETHGQTKSFIQKGTGEIQAGSKRREEEREKGSRVCEVECCAKRERHQS